MRGRREPTAQVADASRIGPFLLAILWIYLGTGVTTNLSDYTSTAYVPIALLQHGTFALGNYIPHAASVPYYIVQNIHHQFVSKSPVGAALTALPFYIPYVVFGGSLAVGSVLFIQKVAASLIMLVAIYLLWRLLSVLGTPNRIRWLVATLFGLGSENLSVASQALWQHGPVELWMLVMILIYVERWHLMDWGWWGLGLAGGMILLTRPPDLIVIAPLAIWIVAREWRKVRVEWLVAGAILPLGFGALYNWWNFGSALATGYGSTTGYFANPIGLGLLETLVSPSKGLFVYMPLAALVVASVWRSVAHVKDWHDLEVPLGVSFVLGVLLYAAYYQWWGGYTFGPRYDADLMPVVCVLIGLVLTRSGRHPVSRWLQGPGRAAVILLVAWSVWWQLLGAYLTYGFAWNAAAIPSVNAIVPQAIWNIRDSELAYYWGSFTSLYSPAPWVGAARVRVKVTSPDVGKCSSRAICVVRVHAGASIPYTAVLTNASKAVLPSYRDATGLRVTFVDYRTSSQVGGKWLPTNGSGDLGQLLRPIAPGTSERVYGMFAAPTGAGVYRVTFGAYQEGGERYKALSTTTWVLTVTGTT